MPRFYVNFSLDSEDCYSLPENVVRHINVLRLRQNSEIELFNGDGNNYLAQITELDKREVIVKVLEIRPANNYSKIPIILAMSIISADKFDLVLQKAVELGVSRIIPVYSQHTQRFKSEKLALRMEHWAGIIIAASEQSGRAELATLEQPVELAQLISSFPKADKFILSPYHDGMHGFKNINNNKIMVLLVGPEGGFTDKEVDLALNNGFQPLLLGHRILRAETAAIAGVCYLHTRFGDFII